MTYENIKQKFEETKEVRFKLYSLEYIVKQVDDYVVIYAILYEKRKMSYKSLEEAFNLYSVYNESLMDSLNKIKIV